MQPHITSSEKATPLGEWRSLGRNNKYSSTDLGFLNTIPHSKTPELFGEIINSRSGTQKCSLLWFRSKVSCVQRQAFWKVMWPSGWIHWWVMAECALGSEAWSEEVGTRGDLVYSCPQLLSWLCFLTVQIKQLSSAVLLHDAVSTCESTKPLHL